MNTDHAEFIKNQHHRNAEKKPVKGRQGVVKAAIYVSILSLYLALMVFIVRVTQIDQAMIVASVLVFATATIVAFAARRAQYLQAKQEKKLVLLKEVLEGSRGGRLVMNSAGKTYFYNQRFIDICPVDGDCGYHNLVEMFSDNERAVAMFGALSDKAYRGLSDSIELYCTRRDYEGWYAISAQPVSGHEGYVHWRIDNVTQRHTEERAVYEEREKLIDFTDNAPIGFFSLNETGHFVFANATLARWLGVDLQQLLGQAPFHTYIENPPHNARPFDIVAQGGDTQIAELEMKGQGGKALLVSVNQSIVTDSDGSVRTRAVVHDLTAERKMRRALKVSEDRFRRFYEEAPLGIILVNKDGVIETCNDAFAKMTAQHPDALEGQHFKTLIALKDRHNVLSLIDEMNANNTTFNPMEVSLTVQDDAELVTQLHARRFSDGDNTALHFINITEQKSLEAQFVQSQKMQAVGQLAGGIAHDFNNLLTAIIGFCDLLLIRHKPGDPSFGDLMQIHQNSNRAANLVRQLLAFSRQQTLRQKVHDVTDILTELSHLIRRLIGANIDFDIRHGDDLGLVKVDEGQLEQVLINLAVNARDAMEHGGELSISTENFTNRNKRSVMQEEMPAGHWVLIKVSDTGCGIAQDNMSRILEPFFTTKAVGEGTGLGLAMVYGIVRQSGGFLDIDSNLGEGTTFKIYLPRSSDIEDAEVVVEPAQITSQDLTGNARILLVEDEDAVRTFSQRALVNKGYDVVTADNGQTALTLYESEHRGEIDLLITDVVMPDMDGPTLAHRIRQHSPSLKIIFMSGYTEDKLKDYMDDRVYFLPKPFTLKVLAEKVKGVLDD